MNLPRAFFAVLPLSAMVVLTSIGCDSRSEKAPKQAFGKQFEVEPYRNRSKSLLDRTYDVQNADRLETTDTASTNAAGTGLGDQSGFLTFGATGGSMTATGWEIDDKLGIAKAGSDNATFDLRLVDVNAVGADYKQFYERGEKLLKEGRTDQALLAFNEAKTLNPKNFQAYVGEAFCYFHRKEFGKALAAIEFAIQSAPDKLVLYGHRGNIRASLGNYNGAIDDFNRLLRDNPRDVAALAARAQYQSAVGNIQASIADYTAGLKEQPDNVALLINRGVAYYRRQQLKETIADATAALERQPALIDAFFLRAIARYRLQDVAAGRADFDEAVRLGLNAKMAAPWRQAFYPGEPVATP